MAHSATSASGRVLALVRAHPSLVAALLSVVAYDFFFIPPYYSFAVSDLRHLLTFGVMLVVATVISGLTRRVRVQADAARGETHAYTLWHILFQLINHNTQHRSELAERLTTFGYSPGDLDFFLFARPVE